MEVKSTVLRTVARIRQEDGSSVVLLAQDERHARFARAILSENREWIDHLDGLGGIRITVVPARRRNLLPDDTFRIVKGLT